MFDEIQFPVDISRGAVSSTQRHLDVVTTKSGKEYRNTTWSNSKRSYNVALGIRSVEDIYATLLFWEGRRGGLREFRFKDWIDFKSAIPTEAISNTDEILNLITVTTFQLQKTYSSSMNPWTRTITKPVDNNTMMIRDDTGDLVETVDYSVDYSTGVVTFFVAPTGIPSAGFEFDVPVRFEDDTISASVELAEVGSIPDINLVEVRI